MYTKDYSSVNPIIPGRRAINPERNMIIPEQSYINYEQGYNHPWKISSSLNGLSRGILEYDYPRTDADHH